MSLGPFSQTRILGATITRISGRNGLENHGGEMTIEVVEDFCKGTRIDFDEDGNQTIKNNVIDDFQPTQLGEPIFVSFGTLRFGGIFRNWEQSKDPGGGIRYTVRIEIPTELLEGSLVVLNAPGNIVLPPNMYALNWWCNDAGVTWDILRLLIHRAQLFMDNHLYVLDVSEIPGHALRFTGDSVNFLDLITRACEAAGLEFFIELVPPSQFIIPPLPPPGLRGVIKIRTVNAIANDTAAITINNTVGSPVENRLNLGIINTFIGSSTCDTGITRQSRGIEYRNDITNIVVTGEYVHRMFGVVGGVPNIIKPFWGMDKNGAPIIGKDNIVFDTEAWQIPCPGVGAFPAQYTINTDEFRSAMSSYESWLIYLQQVKPAIVDCINSPRLLNLANVLKMINGVNQNPDELINGEKVEQAKRRDPNNLDAPRQLFEVVRKIADEHFGKSFAVPIVELICCDQPNINIDVKTSYEKAEGGWTENPALGLPNPSPALELFKIDDGRIGPMVRFDAGAGNKFDIARLAGVWFAEAGNPNRIWVQASFEDIVFLNPANCDDPVAILKIASPIFQQEDVRDEARLLILIGKLLLAGVNPNAAQLAQIHAIHKKIGGDKLYFPLLGPIAIPSQAAVPLKSNTLKYGPWLSDNGGNQGIGGKVDYIPETSLAPWEFGSTALMAIAGQITADAGYSAKNLLESGSVTVTDSPTVVRLGDRISAGGPPLTNIEINHDSTAGVTTTYRMRSHTPRTGQIAQSNVAVLQKLGRRAQRVQRAFRLSRAQKLLNKFQFAELHVEQAKKPGSSHTIFSSELTDRDAAAGTKDTEVVITNKYKNPAELGFDDDTIWITKAASDSILNFRAFSTNTADTIFPRWETPDSTLGGDGTCQELGVGGAGNLPWFSLPTIPPVKEEGHFAITVDTIDPLQNDGGTLGTSVGHDIRYICRDGVGPADISIRQDGDTYGDTYRAIGFKLPAIGVGWGFDIDGRPVPNSHASYPDQSNLEFKDDWLSRQQDWKAGPIDLRWDYKRMVWTCPPAFSLITATLHQDMIPVVYGGTGCAEATMTGLTRQISDNTGGSISGYINVQDALDQPLCSGTKIIAWFDAENSDYHILQAQYKPLCVITDLCGASGDTNSVYYGTKSNGPIKTTNLEANYRTVYLQSAWSPEGSGIVPSMSGIHVGGEPF